MRFHLLIAVSLFGVGCSSPFGGYGELEELDDDAAVTEDSVARDTRAPRDTAEPPEEEDASEPVADTATAKDTAPPKDTATPPPVDTGPPMVAGCSVTLPGATGKESGGLIPVCCTPGATDKAAIMEVFRMVNEHRAANGRGALVYDDNLEGAIQAHCEHMSKHTFFDHSAPESAVSSFTTRAKKCGASAGGENIAWGYSSAKSVMDGWKTSPGHNSNMLGSSWKRMAVGKAGTHWGQMFAP